VSLYPETVVDDRHTVNPLDSKGNYSAASNNTKLVHWPLMYGLLHLVQWGGDRGGLWLTGRAVADWTGCGGLDGLSSRPVPSSLY